MQVQSYQQSVMNGLPNRCQVYSGPATGTWTQASSAHSMEQQAQSRNTLNQMVQMFQGVMEAMMSAMLKVLQQVLGGQMQQPSAPAGSESSSLSGARAPLESTTSAAGGLQPTTSLPGTETGRDATTESKSWIEKGTEFLSSLSTFLGDLTKAILTGEKGARKVMKGLKETLSIVSELFMPKIFKAGSFLKKGAGLIKKLF